MEGDGREVPGWDVLEDPEGRSGPAPRRRWLVAAATVPWLVVAALALRGGAIVPGPAVPEPALPGPAGTAPPPPAEQGAPTAAAPSPSLAPAAVESTAPAGDGTLEVTAFGLPESQGPGHAAALGALVARAWLSDVGPPLDAGVGSAATGAFVEQLAVESVEWPAPGAAVVSVAALLLASDGARYTEARPVRVAVPVRIDGGHVRPAGPPWWLPPPDLVLDEPAWERVDDPPLVIEATLALEAAGYRDVTVERLDASEAWPWRAVAAAVAPGQTDPATHTVWLRDSPAGLVVAGWPTRHGEVGR